MSILPTKEMSESWYEEGRFVIFTITIRKGIQNPVKHLTLPVPIPEEEKKLTYFLFSHFFVVPQRVF